MTSMALMATIILLGTAGSFLPIGILLAARSVRLRWCGLRAWATVVAYEGDAEGADPVVEFQDHTNRTWRVRLWFCNGPVVGGSMEVVYLREKPERARGNSFGCLWALPVLLIALGCGALLFGVGVLFGLPVERG